MGQQLSHIGLIRASNPLATHGKPQSFSIGAGRPPVPTKLVQKIESGAFVDMVELLPERLDTADSEDTRLKRKKGRSPYWNGFSVTLSTLLWWPENNLHA